MAQCFRDEVDDLLPRMWAALDRGDLIEVGRLAHRMKGTLVYLGAEPANEALRRVEAFLETSDAAASEAADVIRHLEQQCLMLEDELTFAPIGS